MLEFVDLPMHAGPTGLVQLADVLSAFPHNEWAWSVLDFYGIGIAPDGLSMQEFEETIRSSPLGLRMSWTSLTNFARDLDQTHECVIVAVRSVADLETAVRSGDEFEACLAVIRALDSTSWSIAAVSGSSAAAQVRRVAMRFR